MSGATALWGALRAAIRPFTGAVAMIAACCSCSSPPTQVTAPPVNPLILNVVGDITFPFKVICDGPKDELALLGEFCGDPTESVGWYPTDAPAGMALWVEPSRDGPFLFVFNYLDYRPDPSANVAGEVKYSAYVVFDHDGEDAISTIDKWQHGESVSSGAVRTQLVMFTPCALSWRAQGTFVWRSTTIQLAWDGGQGC